LIETGAENLSDALDAYLNSQLTEIEMEDLSEKMVLDLTISAEDQGITELSKLVIDILEKYGIRVDRISFEWLDTSTASERSITLIKARADISKAFP
jgi:hypothetical protein